MTRFGVGPRWIVFSLALAAPAIAAWRCWPEAFRMGFLPRGVAIGIGIGLTAVGLPFFLVALVTLHRGFARGQLFTRGVYGLCRHPIYASWIVFFVPAIAFFFDCWLALCVPLAMFAVLSFLVREEEDWLEETFGDEYRAYRERVPAVLPIPRFFRR